MAAVRKIFVEVEVGRTAAELLCVATASIRSDRSGEPDNIGVAYADTEAQAVAEAIRQVANYLSQGRPQ